MNWLIKCYFSCILTHSFHHLNKEEIQKRVFWLSVVSFWIRVSDFEAATVWNRVIPCNLFKLTNQMLFFLLTSSLFSSFQYRVIKIEGLSGYQWWGFGKERRNLRQLRPEAGESLAIFLNWLIKSYFSFLLICDFHRLIKQVNKGKKFINDRENICRPLRQLQPETGKSPAKFSNY